MRNIVKTILVVFLLGVLLAGQSLAASGTTPEQKIKAAFVYNFMKFIEWPKPEKQVEEQKKVLRIGMVCNKSMFKVLEPMLGKEVRGKKIVLEQLGSYKAFAEKNKSETRKKYAEKHTEKLNKCQMLYICASEGNYFKDVLAIVGDRPIITVGDADGFAAKGGTIGFIKRDKKLCFEINVKTVKKAKLKISSKLLSLAKRIYGREVVPAVMERNVD